MVNYGNGKIYKITANGAPEVYIGSTTKKYLSQRFDSHRWSYGQWKEGTRDLTASFLLFDKYGINNCNIVLLENCACNSRDELRAREQYYIQQTENYVNRHAAFNSEERKKEWQKNQRQKEHIKKYNKEYQKNTFQKKITN